MNKRILITSLTAAALAGVFLSGANVNETVKADVKSDGTTTKANTAEENAQANLDSAQKEADNAQQDVSSAKANLDSAQSNAVSPDAAYSTQKDKTDAAQKEEANKKTALDNAKNVQKQAEELNNEAKQPGSIDKANQAVNNQQADLAKKQQAVTDAQKQLSDKQKEVASAQQDINAKNTDLTNKQNAKQDADRQVKDAEDALKGTGINETKKALDDAQVTVENDQADLATAKDNVTKYTNAQTKATQNKANAEKEYTQVQNSVKSANQANEKANAEYNDANTNLGKQQAQISDLTKQLNQIKELSKNNIVIPDIDKFKKAYTDYVNNGELTQDDINYVNSARDKNEFISSDADKDNIVNANNLTDDQLTELSLFTADLLGKLRGQLGWSQDQVSKGSLQMARDVATNYLNDNWTGSWHDGNAVNAAAEKNGLDSVTDDTRFKDQYYEDKEDSSEDIPTLSMDELKQRVYNMILGMVFPDGNGYDSPDETESKYEMGHTAGLLGISSDGFEDSEQEALEELESIKSNLNEIGGYSANINDNSYDFVINKYDIDDEFHINGKSYTKDEFEKFIDSRINEMKNGEYVAAITTNISDSAMPFIIHAITISPENIDSYQKFDTTKIPTYAEQIADLSKKLEGLQKELTNLEKIKNQKLSALSDTQQSLKNAQKKENGVATRLSDVQGQLSKAVQDLKNANDDVARFSQLLDPNVKDSDQAKLNDLQQRFNVLTASNEEKTRILNNAVSNQKIAQNNLADAQKALNNAQTKLTRVKAEQGNITKDIEVKQGAVKDAQKQLDQLNQHLSDLKNAPQILKAANDAVVKAQSEYDAAKKAADDAQSQLKKLEPAKLTADAKVAAAQNKYDSALANLKAAQDKLANAKAALEQIKQSEDMMNQFVPNIISDNTSSSENSSAVSNVTSDNNSSSENTSVSASEYKSVKLTHNAYIYTKTLKTVKNIILKKGSYLKAWNNGKVYVIKGKKYYQIGKNKFVKVANTVAKKSKSYVAVVKGRKNHKVRVYLGNGKFAKKYVYGQKIYKFAEKKIIKGKTYYRISGKKLWIPASKLDLKK